MWKSFIKKISKYEKNASSFEDILKYMKYVNREIQIDNITPQNADIIDSLIRFWNICDEENKKNFAEREPIKLYINSLGGNLDAALSIVDSISISRTPIYTFNIGTVQKESFLIFLAGDKRFAYENSSFLYSNNLLTSTEKIDNNSNFYNEDILKDFKYKNIKRFFLDRVKINEAQYDKHCKNDWYFSAEDAFKIHIANEISRKHYHYVEEK